VRALVDVVRAQAPGLPVYESFLDLSSPRVRDVLQELYTAGHRTAVVVPLLLGSAFHARVDLPALIDSVTASCPGFRVQVSDVLGADPALQAVALDRLAAAPRRRGTGVLLTGRSEGFIAGRPDLAETIRRLVAYAEAGADCLYAPGVRAMSDISAIVKAVAPRPVNVLVGTDFTTVAQLAEAGVRRISVGGALARAAWTGFLSAAREIATTGTFSELARNVPVPEMNKLFSPVRRHDQS